MIPPRVLIGMLIAGEPLRKVVNAQTDAMEFLLLERERLLGEIERHKVEYSRWGRDIIANFLIALDRPEEEEALRDTLHQALIDMADEVARLEEHAPV